MAKKKKKKKILNKKKVMKLTEYIQNKIKLNSYILKNSSVNIFEKIITNCIKDEYLSGLSPTKSNEKIFYKRTKKAIEFNINNSAFILEI